METTPDRLEPGRAVKLEDIRQGWSHAGIEHALSEGRSRIMVGKIVVPAATRSQGIGSAAMRMLNEYADFTGQVVALSPSNDFGATSVSRLQRFYRALGYVRNTGSKRDFSVSESMLREPMPSQRPRAQIGFVLASRDVWAMDCDYKERGARLVSVTPSEYIAAVRSLSLDEESCENIAILKARLQDGLELDPLAIYAPTKEDGRHRAYAARELGLEAVPVLDFCGRFPQAPDWPIEAQVERSRMRH